MCPLVGVHDVRGDGALVLVLEVPEHVLVLGLAGADEHELGVAVDELLEDGGDEVEAFLIGETGDEGDHELPVVHFEAQFFLESPLVGFLALDDAVHVELLRDLLVGGGVPDIVVDAVDDAAELHVMVPDDRVEVLAILCRLDLSRVGVGDGGDDVGIDERAFEHVGVVVDLELVRREDIVRQAGEILDEAELMLALELEVVDRDDGLGVLAGPGVPEQGVEIDRNEACLPVVAVDDVRLEPDDGEGCQDRLVEENELPEVLRHAGVGVAVGEVLFVVDEVVDDAVLFEFHDADILHDARARDVHVEVADILHALFILVRDARVFRHHDPYVDAFRSKSLGQGAHDVSESARLREGVAFGTDKQYFHV